MSSCEGKALPAGGALNKVSQEPQSSEGLLASGRELLRPLNIKS